MRSLILYNVDLEIKYNYGKNWKLWTKTITKCHFFTSVLYIVLIMIMAN